MLFLLLIFVLSGMALTVLIWVGTLFLQGYFYTEPTAGIVWQAPAAGFTMAIFYTFWCMLIVNSEVTNLQDLPYDTIFSFKPDVDKFKEPVKELWIVKKGTKEPIRYKLKKAYRGGIVTSEYIEADTGRVYSPSGVEEIIISEDGQKTRFLPTEAPVGSGYRLFKDENGWTIREYPQSGPTGLPEAFRWSRFLVNIVLNVLHLILWFVCLWVFVRFQWSHALGLALVMWLIMTLAVLPMMFEQAGRRAQTASTSPREKVSLPSIRRDQGRARSLRAIGRSDLIIRSVGRGARNEGCITI